MRSLKQIRQIVRDYLLAHHDAAIERLGGVPGMDPTSARGWAQTVVDELTGWIDAGYSDFPPVAAEPVAAEPEPFEVALDRDVEAQVEVMGADGFDLVARLLEPDAAVDFTEPGLYRISQPPDTPVLDYEYAP